MSDLNAELQRLLDEMIALHKPFAETTMAEIERYQDLTIELSNFCLAHRAALRIVGDDERVVPLWWIKHVGPLMERQVSPWFNPAAPRPDGDND